MKSPPQKGSVQHVTGFDLPVSTKWRLQAPALQFYTSHLPGKVASVLTKKPKLTAALAERKSLSNMKLLFGLILVLVSIKLSRFQCVLEKEYFCSSIPNGFPEGLTSILFVVTNIGILNSTVFSSPSLASVSSLALANSGITKIKPGAFSIFQNLRKLSLYQNSVTEVTASWLSNPGHLENLTVAQNLIASIGPKDFSGFSNLTSLNLANNQIYQISSKSFKDLTKLTLLDLSGNKLTTLARDVFDGLMLPVLKLGGNPWNCSCQLQDFGLFLQELINASLLEDAASVICRSPPNLEGIPVWNISDLNCLPDFFSSAFENSFHKVGLPALLVCLVLISFILMLLLIWMVKRSNQQIQPSKEATDLTTNGQPSDCVDSMAEHRLTDGKIRITETGVMSHSRLVRVRAKSASAILLQAEFCPRPCQATNLADEKQGHLTTPFTLLNEKMHVRSEDLCNFMELWYYHKLETDNRKEFQRHCNVSSFPTEVYIETPDMKVTSEVATKSLQENCILGASENDDSKGCDSVENPEPFLYLSVATTTVEEQIDAPPKKDVVIKAGGNCSVSLKRALTWPYEIKCLGQRSNVLSIRESFKGQFLLPTLNLEEKLDVGSSEFQEEWLEVHPRKACQPFDKGQLELNQEANLAKETEFPYQQESRAEIALEPTDVGKSEFTVDLQRQHDLSTCPKEGDHIVSGRTELKTEVKQANQPEFSLQPESNAAVASQSGLKTMRGPTAVKRKQSSKPVSAQSKVRQESHPSPLSSADVASTSLPRYDEISLENDEYNYASLLHEVVENRGRWTRERWRQTHRKRSVNQPPTKSK
uniref:uncharacterized protein LOC114589404 n=1 Tax=Podarcis muralis TaxID=64176 RepID=UPI0010A09925|nr:uncharacterized protein LOC114589404 [Podarcis muralis]